MATIVLSAAGMALGGSIGGSVLGLSMATIGRAAGAALGQRIDQTLLGSGSAAVETGRIDRFRITSAAEGADVQRVYGRMRVAGQVIWATQFFEDTTTTGGGKGSRPTPTTTTYSYSVSLAVALCEGVISGIGRVWADGAEISPEVLNMRVYRGSDDQQPDPKIAAVEGAENAPAYRGIAYVVLEDLALGQFGNRIPQLTFEVVRSASDEIWGQVQGVVLGDGCGEYGLAVTQLHGAGTDGVQRALNTHSPLGGSDFAVAVDAMQRDLPGLGSVVLPVAWFGDDLRCASCAVAPMVSEGLVTSDAMPWRVGGIAATALPAGMRGTPTDRAVREAIADLQARGLAVTLEPRLRMIQEAGNGLPDPWGDAEQAATPWCGRLTLSVAAGEDGSPDGTAAAVAEIAAFFGAASAADFQIAGQQVTYQGAAGGYRRMVLHYAHLALAAGGVDSFLIGTDLAGLTRIRDADGNFPAVAALRALAADVRAILGPDCRIGYAADGAEALGYTPPGTQDRLFPLDPLWADAQIDFVGINARMPLSDWREGEDHRDAAAGSVHDLTYLQGNVAGGEGYDWHYPTPEARAAQRRVPIMDPDGEDWVWRTKDFRGWWDNPHHPRVDGVRLLQATDWVPQGKPIRMLSLGCRAVDLGTNTPDPAVLGRELPHYAQGIRDDLIQQQYLRAVLGHYAAENPVSQVYGGPMMDLAHAHARCWDPRPFPFFPTNLGQWPDGGTYPVGATLNGRASGRSLASVVAEICDGAGVRHYDVSQLFGVVRGYMQSGVETGRAGLQPLMLAFGFEAVMRDGVLVFRAQRGTVAAELDPLWLARDPDSDEHLRLTRAPKAALAGRVQVGFLDADADYAPMVREAALPDDPAPTLNRSEFPLVMTSAEGGDCVARWLQEARAGRDTVQFSLPPSRQALGAGDIVAIDGATYRIARIEEAGVRLVEAARVATQTAGATGVEDISPSRPVAFAAPVPAEMLFMDLPLLTGDEQPHAPHVAVAGNPWPGSIALYTAAQDSGYALEGLYEQPSVIGVTETVLPEGPVGLWQRVVLRVAFSGGALASATPEALLAGANTLAIGSGAAGGWEVIQFRDATPVAGGYLLTGLLRGQKGSWGEMPGSWPVGSRVVLLNGVPRQLGLPSAARGTERHFRFGPSSSPMSDASYRYQVHRFDGVGLRPYPVVHLRAHDNPGAVDLSWIRCTRIDGDIWDGVEVPLGEDSESYLLRVRKAGVVVREVLVLSPAWTYPAAQIASDIGSGPYTVCVAQVSARFGAGPEVAVVLAA